jgi:hypothetical protein
LFLSGSGHEKKQTSIYIIAELSANHNGSLERAKESIRAIRAVAKTGTGRGRKPALPPNPRRVSSISFD